MKHILELQLSNQRAHSVHFDVVCSPIVVSGLLINYFVSLLSKPHPEVELYARGRSATFHVARLEHRQLRVHMLRQLEMFLSCSPRSRIVLGDVIASLRVSLVSNQTKRHDDTLVEQGEI